MNAGANPDAHLWILCNPDIPRKTPFVLDLGGSVLIFEVSRKSLGVTHRKEIYSLIIRECAPATGWQGWNNTSKTTHVLQTMSLLLSVSIDLGCHSKGIARLAVIAYLRSAGSVVRRACAHWCRPRQQQ